MESRPLDIRLRGRAGRVKGRSGYYFFSRLPSQAAKVKRRWSHPEVLCSGPAVGKVKVLRAVEAYIRETRAVSMPALPPSSNAAAQDTALQLRRQAERLQAKLMRLDAIRDRGAATG